MSGSEAHGLPAGQNRVAVVLVNYHSEQLLQPCLAALAGQTRSPDRVVVVDNGSQAERLAEVLAGCPLAELLPMPGNVGFAPGNNRAVETITDCRWIVLLNVDTVPQPDWLEALLNAAARYPDCTFFGSLLLIANSPDQVDGTGDVYHCSGRHWRRDHGTPAVHMHRETAGTIGPCAAAAMYRYDAWLAVGGFDESFVCYSEDMDLGLRLNLEGHTYRHVPESVVHHIGSAVTKRHSEYYVYHGQRNMVWVYVKNMPGSLFWKYLLQHLLYNLLAVVWFSLHGRALAVLRAKWDAVRGLPRVWRQRRVIQQNRRLSVRDFNARLAHGIGRLLRRL